MVAHVEWAMPVTWSDLPTRQQEVLLAVARGRSNREIAADLGIAEATVRNAIADLYDKLDLTNRVEALRWVLRHEELAVNVLESV